MTHAHADGHVLLVDDDPDIRDSLSDLLALYGYTTAQAADGARALAMMNEKRPCLVVLDLMMPVMDGFQLLERMRADGELAETPVVVISAGRLDEARKLEVAAVLQKPLDIDRLMNHIRDNC